MYWISLRTCVKKKVWLPYYITSSLTNQGLIYINNFNNWSGAIRDYSTYSLTLLFHWCLLIQSLKKLFTLKSPLSRSQKWFQSKEKYVKWPKICKNEKFKSWASLSLPFGSPSKSTETFVTKTENRRRSTV